MNIINRFKKWFFNEENIGIINIGDLLKIPGREYYKDDLEKLNQIDIYKEEYYKILSKRKLISSKELSFDNLEKEFLMNIQLILNFYLNNDIINEQNELESKMIYHNPHEYIYINYYIDKKINLIKLQLYLNDINNMEIETIEKLIALEELSKGKRVALINRMPLNEKINNLKIILDTIHKQKIAISLEINNYLLNLSSNNQSFYNNDEIESFLIKKYQTVYDLAKNYIKEGTLENIAKLDNDISIKIALIEKELEIYVYTHKDDINMLNQELDILDNTKKNLSNQKELLNKIKVIEDKYHIFNEYGRNIVIYDNLYKLYKIKFDILTIDINYLENSPLINENEQAKKFYKDITDKKIQRILMGENSYIEEIYDNDYKEAIKLIAFYLKGSLSQFRLDNILIDKLKLALLLAFDKKDGLVQYFNQNKIRIDDNQRFSLDYDPRMYKFQEEIPLDTCFQIMTANDDNKHYQFNHPLYKLYKLTANQPQFLNSNIYDLMEGLISIRINRPLDEDDNILEYINKKAHNKTVIFPQSLEEIDGRLFNKETCPKNIILNRGLKRITNNALKGYEFEHLFLPSSIEYISPDAMDFNSVKWLYFMDYENSKILHDEESLLLIIHNLFNVVKINDDSDYEKIDDNNLNVYRERIKVAIRTNLKDINLYDDRGKEILVINTQDLEIIKNRWRENLKDKKPSYYSYDFSGKWLWYAEKNIYSLQLEDAIQILNRLKTIIKAETGHELTFIKKKEKQK